jgi:hypothetical protein
MTNDDRVLELRVDNIRCHGRKSRIEMRDMVLRRARRRRLERGLKV